MPYKGAVKNHVVVLEEGVTLPEGMPVIVIPEEEMQNVTRREQWERFDTGAEQVFQRLLAERGMTSDSVEILRQLREERANR